MNLERALQIPGWTYDTELAWLAEQASQRSNIVEIGSWRGRSTRAMADNTKGVVIAVDTFEGTEADGHWKELEGKPHGWLFTEFCANNQDLINSLTVFPYRGKSIEVAKHFAEAAKHTTAAKFDMIFVDGPHDYESVKADFLAWLPLLAPGGLFCGHDYDGGRPGVEKALRELIPNFIKVGIGSLWMRPI